VSKKPGAEEITENIIRRTKILQKQLLVRSLLVFNDSFTPLLSSTETIGAKKNFTPQYIPGIINKKIPPTTIRQKTKKVLRKLKNDLKVLNKSSLGNIFLSKTTSLPK
jgi:hypothetical protein